MPTSLSHIPFSTLYFIQLTMISIMYLVIPTVINLVIALVLSRLKVEQVNAKLVSEKE